MWAASLGIVDTSASPAIQKKRRWKGHIFAMHISGETQRLWLMGIWDVADRQQNACNNVSLFFICVCTKSTLNMIVACG